jgi:hypothetical protein
MEQFWTWTLTWTGLDVCCYEPVTLDSQPEPQTPTTRYDTSYDTMLYVRIICIAGYVDRAPWGSVQGWSWSKVLLPSMAHTSPRAALAFAVCY